jgi:hypothetical protein
MVNLFISLEQGKLLKCIHSYLQKSLVVGQLAMTVLKPTAGNAIINILHDDQPCNIKITISSE